MAVITSLRLDVTAPNGGEAVSFGWDEQGTWQYDTVNRELTWIYLADPAPLVVSPSSPRLPICLFEGPPGWQWQAGTYQVRILAGREQENNALQSDFTLTLPQASVDYLEAQPRTWVEARTWPA